MRRRLTLLAALAAPLVGLTLAPGTSHADPDVLVYPGMEIHQGTTVCTLGYVDPQLRVAFTAGHCRGDGPVSDQNGHYVGNLAMFRDDTPDGATIDTNHQISDWEAIGLGVNVQASNVLPGGRVLESDPNFVLTPGQQVCHFGVITSESCGTVAAVNNGWFTMDNGVVSQKGDSGGPVYAITDDGRAVIVGMFNSTWGQFPAAVSWQAASQQIRDDVLHTASATVVPAAGLGQ